MTMAPGVPDGVMNCPFAEAAIRIFGKRIGTRQQISSHNGEYRLRVPQNKIRPPPTITLHVRSSSTPIWLTTWRFITI